MATKYCPDCELDLPTQCFTRNASRPDGLAFYCKKCLNSRVLASKRRRLGPPRTKSHQGPALPAGLKWCADCSQVKPLKQFPKNRSQRSGYGSYCRECHARRSRVLHLRRNYGITVADFDRMFAEQNGVCAICREAPAEHVDHDHVTGRVRGLQWGSPRQSGRSRRGSFNCNGALSGGPPANKGVAGGGQFRDRTDLMLQAVAYLRGGDWQSAHELPGVTVCFALVNEDPGLAPPADAA